MTSQPPSGPHGWSRRRWWLLVAGLGLLILGYAVYEFLRDDPPPYDDDLMAEFTPGPDEENGALLLAELADQIKDHADGPFLDEIMEPEDGSPPDWEAVRAYLAERAEAIDQLDAVLAAPHFHGPWPPEIGGSLSLLKASLNWGKVLGALARLQVLDTDSTAAWQTLRKSLKLGQRIGNSHQMSIGMLTGVAFKSIALETLRDHLFTLAPNRKIAKQRIEELGAFRFSEEKLRRMLREEYMVTLSFPRIIAAEGGLYVTGGDPPMPTLFYKPNRTQALFARYFREGMRNVGLTASERDFSEFEELMDTYMDRAWHDVSNFTGYMLLGLAIPMLEPVLMRVDELNSRLELTRLGLALAGYANEHGGALPPTLDALAPDYINAVPLDPFTGEPFHYDPAARKVW
ncbi:MAG: hypothetical protein AAGK14_11940, partial [Verrucomicrobiota bacterium]